MIRTMFVGVFDADKIAEYERLHNNLPAVILHNLRGSGVTDLKIYRLGTTAVMMIDRDEHFTPAGNYDQVAEDAWQKATGACFVQRWREMPMIFELPEIKDEG
jgi:L-rhamnose mutarotase